MDINEILLKLKNSNFLSYQALYSETINYENYIKNMIDMQNKNKNKNKSKIDIDINTCNISLDSIRNKYSEFEDIHIELPNDTILNLFNNENNKYFITGKILNNIYNKISDYEISVYDQLSYTNIENILKNNSAKKYIKLNKKIYSSISEILLDIDKPIHRFGYDSNSKLLYGTVSFYIDLFLLISDKNLMKINMYINNKLLKNDFILHNIVVELNYDKLIEYKKEITLNYEQLNDTGLTPIELAIQLYAMNTNHILRSKALNIIILLSEYTYRRPPILFAQTVSFLRDIYDILIAIKCKYNIKNTNIDNKNININDSDVNKINMYLMEKIINDDHNYVDNFMDFMSYIGYKNLDKLLNIQINDPHKVKDILIQMKNIKAENICNLILYYEFIDLYEQLDITCSVKNILSLLIVKQKYVSILYLLKVNRQLIKEIINDISFYESIIGAYEINQSSIIKYFKLFDKYDINIFGCINDDNDNNNNLLHYISTTKPKLLYDILDILLKNKINIDLQKQNIYGDTFLHILFKNKITKSKPVLITVTMIENILDICQDIINIQNLRGESILMISAINHYEEIMLILLEKYVANDLLQDIHGNTVYHYICINKLMIGYNIKNDTINKYGYKPQDYTLLKKYWNFI
jgi:hypothetical protein